MLIITGQTAAGKTQLALQYAQKYNGELINCDSRQIYQDLDLVTGKDLEEKKFYRLEQINQFQIGYYLLSYAKTPIPVWLYDVVAINHYFSSFDYRQLALKVITNILARKKTPILIGGSYLYLYHLLYQINTDQIPPNFALRKTLVSLPLKILQQKLFNLDKELFTRLNTSDRQNPQRLIRKIEIAQYFQKKQQKSPGGKLNFKLADDIKSQELKIIGLKISNKQLLKEKIKKRVEKRLALGAVEEVKKILAMGFKPDAPGLKTIGCQTIIKFLKKEINQSELINEWVNKEMQYAKRQLTFMKKDPHIVFIEA